MFLSPGVTPYDFVVYQRQQECRRHISQTHFANAIFSLLLFPKAVRQNSLGKVPIAQGTRSSPQITISVPVLTLCTADFQPQKRTRYPATLIQFNPISEKAPGTINDLGTAFGFELAPSLWALMGGNLHISRHFPHPFAFDLYTLFAVAGRGERRSLSACTTWRRPCGGRWRDPGGARWLEDATPPS